MKHPHNITIWLLLLFFFSQLIGLAVVNQFIDHDAPETEEVVFKEIRVSGVQIERPDVDQNWSWAYFMSAILIGTFLVLLIVKLGSVALWKLWAFVAVTICLSIALTAFMRSDLALVLAVIAAYFKIIKPNYIIHNLSELFIYGGLAAIFVPMMNLLSACLLLIAISIYDIIAVQKSKHMVSMAKFQMKSNFFAGMMIPHKKGKIMHTPDKKAVKKTKAPLKKVVTSTAVLGGGDIGFPLLFTGVIFKSYPLWMTLIIPICSTAALYYLLIKSKPTKFYPAMPFISAGCFIGFLIVQVLSVML